MINFKKILIYHYAAIGDTIVTIPIISCITRYFNNSDIDVFNTHPKADAYHMTLFENLGHLRKLQSQQIFKCLDIRHLFRRIKNLLMIRRENYDCAFIFFLYKTPLWWLWLFKIITGIKHCYYTKDFRKYDSSLFRSLLKQMEEYGFSFTDEERRLLYPLTEENHRNAELFFKKVNLPSNAMPFVLCISASSSKSIIWPADRYVPLLQKIMKKYPFLHPLLFGTSQDREHGEKLLRSIGCSGTYVCELPAPDAIAVMKKCRFYLGNDTGPMHLANSAGIPCVALFSDRETWGTWFPEGNSHKIIIHRLPCEGCMLENCPKGNPAPCFEAITLEEVENAVDDMMKQIAAITP